MKPEQIQVGKKYRLRLRYAILKKTLIREVLNIKDGFVYVHGALGDIVPVPLRDFASWAEEEVKEE